jgi:hypothetical protein
MTYGYDDKDAMKDLLGSVVCKQGRVLAFPNVLQHRVKVCPAGTAHLLSDCSPSVLVGHKMVH